MSSFDIIRENIDNVDLFAAYAKKRVEDAMAELLNGNKEYLNCICGGEYYNEIRNINI